MAETGHVSATYTGPWNRGFGCWCSTVLGWVKQSAARKPCFLGEEKEHEEEGRAPRTPSWCPRPGSCPSPHHRSQGSPGMPLAPAAQQTVSEEPSGGGHGGETPKTSSHLLFLTSLLGCHDNGTLHRDWMGTGQLGTAQHPGDSRNPGHPLVQCCMVQPHPMPSIFWLHPAAKLWMLSPNSPPTAPPQTPRGKSRHGGDPAPSTAEAPLPAQAPVITRTQ